MEHNSTKSKLYSKQFNGIVGIEFQRRLEDENCTELLRLPLSKRMRLWGREGALINVACL